VAVVINYTIMVTFALDTLSLLTNSTNTTCYM